MKKLLLFLLSTSILAHGQAFRWSTTAQTVNSSSPQPGALLPALNIPNATIAVCTYPANGVPCTNYATTYTDPSGTTTCPSAAQLTGNNSAICIAKSDVQGNAGAWLKAGNFQYTMTTLYGSFGPYDVTVGGGGGVAGTVSGQTPTCLPKASGASALTAASAVCDSGATITSTEPIVAPSVSTPALTVTACTLGQVPFGDGSGACVTPSGGGTPGQLAFAKYPATTGTTLSPSNFTYDAATGNTMSGPTFASGLTPYADARFYGAVSDGTTDATAAVQAAINSAMGAGGSRIVFIPDNTYIANASAFTNPTGPFTNQLTFEIAGTVLLGSTFVQPKGASIKCLGGGQTPQFSSGTVVCNIKSPQVHGTMGTAVASTNTPVTFTPTYALGTSLPVGSAITVAGVMTCTTSTVVRTALAGTGGFPGPGAVNVTATFTGGTDSSGNSKACRIPPAAKIVIAGCSDSTFNGTYFSGTVDFPLNQLSWRAVGTGATVGDGSCTVTGLNLDSFETERITAVSGSTVTATFNYVHGAADLWGEVGVTGTFNDLRYKMLTGLQVDHNWGAGYWANANAIMTFDGVSFTGTQYLTSIPMVFTSSWGWTFERSQAITFTPYTCPTVSFVCGDVGPPFGIMIDNSPPSLFGTSGTAGGYIGPNSTVSAGIYYTNALASSTMFATGPVFESSVIEQPMWNGITFDNRRFGPIYQTTIKDSLIQDDVVGWSTAAWIGMSDAGAYGKGSVAFYDASDLAFGYTGAPIQPRQTVNKYYCGAISVNGATTYDFLQWPACPEATVTYNDGKTQTAELVTPPIGPVYIPWPTKLVATAPAAWVCTGCTVTTGISDPIGGTGAGRITSNAGAFGTVQVLNYFNASTAAGDVLLYGTMFTTTDPFAGGNITLSTFGTDTFDVQSATNYRSNIQGGPWHPIVGMSIVQTGQVGSHAISFLLTLGNNTLGTLGDFWQPWVMHIPASAGIPMSTIQMWRMQAMHGYVPSNMATGNNLEIPPGVKMYWGNDTDVYSATVTAALTQIGISSNTLTVTVPNTYTVGSKVSFSGMGTNTDLNGVTVQLITQTATNFTAKYVHADVTLAADAGTVTGHAGVLKTDGAMDATTGYKINGSFGTTGQFMQSTGTGTTWANSSVSEPGNTYDFSPSAATGGISCTGTNPYTCTLPAICNLINYDILSGGSGGGSGATVTAAATGFGGGGGAAGEAQRGVAPCSFFGGPGASITVTVGVGGTAGAAQAGTSANGNPGGQGGLSRVVGAAGYGSITSSAGAGSSFGAGGTGGAGTAGAQSPNLSNMGICPGSAGSSGTGAAQSCQVGTSASAGGAGGGGLVAGTASAGGAQGTASVAQAIRGPAYTAGSVTGGANTGGNGQTPTYNVTPLALFLYSALGGTGGGASCAAAGGTGGTGMEPGAGGAGGGAACNGFSSGAGGAGGPGHVRLTVE